MRLCLTVQSHTPWGAHAAAAGAVAHWRVAAALKGRSNQGEVARQVGAFAGWARRNSLTSEPVSRTRGRTCCSHSRKSAWQILNRLAEQRQKCFKKISLRRGGRIFSLALMFGRLMILHCFAFGLLIGLSVVAGAVAQDRIIGVASVIDGDTIEISRAAHSPLRHRRSRKQPALRAADRRTLALRTASKLCLSRSDRTRYREMRSPRSRPLWPARCCLFQGQRGP